MNTDTPAITDSAHQKRHQLPSGRENIGELNEVQAVGARRQFGRHEDSHPDSGAPSRRDIAIERESSVGSSHADGGHYVIVGKELPVASVLRSSRPETQRASWQLRWIARVVARGQHEVRMRER
ncbi:MAG: hypothetical protein ABI229_01985 [Gemmatimonadaceae bacterium]